LFGGSGKAEPQIGCAGTTYIWPLGVCGLAVRSKKMAQELIGLGDMPCVGKFGPFKEGSLEPSGGDREREWVGL
jgi:hypothetical protein